MHVKSVILPLIRKTNNFNINIGVMIMTFCFRIIKCCFHFCLQLCVVIVSNKFSPHFRSKFDCLFRIWYKINFDSVLKSIEICFWLIRKLLFCLNWKICFSLPFNFCRFTRNIHLDIPHNCTEFFPVEFVFLYNLWNYFLFFDVPTEISYFFSTKVIFLYCFCVYLTERQPLQPLVLDLWVQ